MRRRYSIMLAIAALIVGVVVFQAVTAKPPEPYVSIAGWPAPPEIHYVCSDNGEQMVVYVTSAGEELPPEPTNPRRLCDHVFPSAHQPARGQ